MLIYAGRQIYPVGHDYIRPSKQECYVLEMIYSGSMLRRSGVRREWLEQPCKTLILTPPEIRYQLSGKAEGEEIWLLFNPSPRWRDCLDWPTDSFGVPSLHIPQNPLGERIVQAFEETHRFFLSERFWDLRLAENCLECLFLLTNQLNERSVVTSDQRIWAVVNWIQRKYHLPLTVAKLAKQACLSPSRFAHLFCRETGLPPMQYLERVRMDQAEGFLLRSDLSIQEIAARVGFDDPYYFSTRFRHCFGCSPTAWRKSPGISPKTVHEGRREAF